MHNTNVMLQMVRFEYKKLWRSHLNKILLLILMLTPILGILVGLSNARIDPFCQSDQALYVDGKAYCGIEILKQRNQALHSYAGGMDEAWFELIEQASNQKQMDQQLVIDEIRMQETYGTDWKLLQQTYPDGQLPKAVYERYFPFAHVEQDTMPMEVYYTQASMQARASIAKLYPFVEKDIVLTPDSYLLSKEGYEQEHADNSIKDNSKQSGNFLGYIPSFYDEAYYDYLNTQFLRYDHTYEAQLGVALFMNIMDMNWVIMSLVMVLLGIIVIQLFNQEYTSKSDQLLKPMKYGSKQQAQAKLLCGGSFTVAVTLYIVLVYILFTSFTVGFYDLSTTFIVIDERTLPYLFTCWELLMTSIVMMLVGMFSCYAMLMPLAFLSKTSFQGLLYFVIYMIILFAGGDVIAAISGDQGIFAYAKNLSPIYIMATPYLFSLSQSNVVTAIMHVSLGSSFIPIAYMYTLLWVVLDGSALWWTKHAYQKRNIENA